MANILLNQSCGISGRCTVCVTSILKNGGKRKYFCRIPWKTEKKIGKISAEFCAILKDTNFSTEFREKRKSFPFFLFFKEFYENFPFSSVFHGIPRIFFRFFHFSKQRQNFFLFSSVFTKLFGNLSIFFHFSWISMEIFLVFFRLSLNSEEIFPFSFSFQSIWCKFLKNGNISYAKILLTSQTRQNVHILNYVIFFTSMTNCHERTMMHQWRKSKKIFCINLLVGLMDSHWLLPRLLSGPWMSSLQYLDFYILHQSESNRKIQRLKASRFTTSWKVIVPLYISLISKFLENPVKYKLCIYQRWGRSKYR